ncbi:hypothetical protein BJ322DRAFT_1053244 [Thelephora terrestris]|uniref:Poly A polymerase head domain-containing protein n=1 Tax=Thelephora terrestris TaxID=56493 RepID=A0A9P6L7S6_9AGAM|nr:hypothetical protein BJ322DRAFT_1053244 [Thelephora terrestris]
MRAFARTMSLRSITASRKRITPILPPVVHLNDVEGRLCSLLNEFVEHLKQQDGIQTTCRFAGGWVRDKLLGAESNDIDVAIEDMTGVSFANRLVEFLKSNKNESVRDPITVEANPEQSKHLETAKMKLWGTELDLVNLRAEEYAEDSRIPNQITFGTPLVDALRRDITINSLFYNVHSRSIEDYTEKGLDDLRDGLIRTPLAPRETFLDDPLRVIRTIRFSSRFGYELAQELKDSAASQEIQSALAQKISRDRVGEEVDKMMRGRDPLHAIQLIHELGLYSSIFWTPATVLETFSSTPKDPLQGLMAATILHSLTTVPSPLPAIHPLLSQHFTLHSSTRPRLFLASALTPFKNIIYTDAKGKAHPAVESVLRDGCKLGNQSSYLSGIPTLFLASDLLKNPTLEGERFNDRPERVAIGLLLRDKSVHNPNVGSTWPVSILFSLVQELLPLWRTPEDYDTGKVEECIKTYNRFVSRVEELDLVEVGDAKTVLTGKDLKAVPSAPELPGPWTGRALAQVMEWQLEHPEGTKEECIAWLDGRFADGLVDVSPDLSTNQKRTKGGEGGSAKKTKR